MLWTALLCDIQCNKQDNATTGDAIKPPARSHDSTPVAESGAAERDERRKLGVTSFSFRVYRSLYIDYSLVHFRVPFGAKDIPTSTMRNKLNICKKKYLQKCRQLSDMKKKVNMLEQEVKLLQEKNWLLEKEHHVSAWAYHKNSRELRKGVLLYRLAQRTSTYVGCKRLFQQRSMHAKGQVTRNRCCLF